jgi:hypothetical protein
MRYRPREELTKNKRVVINLTESDHKFIKMIATDHSLTMSRLMLKALKYYLKEKLFTKEELQSE